MSVSLTSSWFVHFVCFLLSSSHIRLFDPATLSILVHFCVRACVCVFLWSQLSSSLLQAKAEEVMIRTWEVESPHRYDNNMDVYKVGSRQCC